MDVINCLVNFTLYGGLFTSLFVIDLSLGNVPLNYLYHITCLLKNKFQAEMNNLYNITSLLKNKFQAEIENQELNQNMSIPMLFVEVVVLSLCMAFIHKYRELRGRDRIDDLLEESKCKLEKCKHFWGRWKKVPDSYSYLDEEPGQIAPLKLEVPILHMAIIDTRGTKPSQPEGGDAGDTIKITDSTLLSVTSLLDDDFDYVPDICDKDKTDNTDNTQEPIHQERNEDFSNRQLWDVIEEEGSESQYEQD